MCAIARLKALRGPTLALAGRGYSVVGLDLSTREIERARCEAHIRGLAADKVGDMRTAHADHGAGYDSSFRVATRSRIC